MSHRKLSMARGQLRQSEGGGDLEISGSIDSGTGSPDFDAGLIASLQHPGGAYPASPNYSQYPYCWLRDGSFIAYAMDRSGKSEGAAAFHAWVTRTVLGHADEIRELMRRRDRGEPIPEHEFLPARFTVDGRWQQDGWPNFQLDGYGHWLWSLGEHWRRSGGTELPAAVADAAALVGDYLATFWQEPCYDAWEEYRSQLHTSTLASIHGGLTSLAGLLTYGWRGAAEQEFRPAAAEQLARFRATAQQVRATILEECVAGGRFVKHIGNPAVDASLLWVSTPFSVVPEDHPLMGATVHEIERTLKVPRGLKRYAADTFYGGGQWLLLTAWLGWHYARLGERERASECLAWVESQRDQQGWLPEQVSSESSNRRFLRFWTERWGPPAKPLLWSHAMALVLRVELQASG